MSLSISEFQNFQIGIIAAFVEAVILQPTVYWKNAKIEKKPFTFSPKLLYRGTMAAAFNEMQVSNLNS